MTMMSAKKTPEAPSEGNMIDGTLERPGKSRFMHYAEASALPMLTLLLILFFSVLPATSDTFPTLANLRVTLGTQSVLIVASMAVLIPLIAQQYDFSAGATVGMGGIFAASAMSSGASIPLALVIACGVGLAIGVVNGSLVTRVGIGSVITTLGTATLVEGVVSWKSGGVGIVQGIPTSLTDFSSKQLLGLPQSFWVAVLVTAAAYYLVRQTPFGRRLEAIGSNREAARLLGLRVERTTIFAFMICGVLAGAAGILQVAQAGTASPTVGPSYTLPAIAAAFLSVAAIQPGRFNVPGTFVAIVFLAVLNSGLNIMGASSYINNFANGGALIAGVALATVLGRRRRAGFY